MSEEVSHEQAMHVRQGIQGAGGGALHAGGASAAQVAWKLGIRPELLYKWRTQSKTQGEEAFPGKGRRPASEETALRRELERVRME